MTRRDLMTSAVAEARALVASRRATGRRRSSADPWPVGIVGLVAARLAEDSARPAIVGAELGDTIRASCRSDGSVDLGAALEACADLFIRYGGHAGAAGFELAAERWPAFMRALRGARRGGRAAPTRASPSRIDLALPALGVDYALHRELGVPGAVRSGQSRAAGGRARADRSRASAPPARITPRSRSGAISTCSTASRSAGRTWPRRSTTVTGSTSSRGVVSRRFGGLETLQLEIRDARASGGHPEAAAILASRARHRPPGRIGAMTRDAGTRPPRAGDPYGVGPIGSLDRARALGRRAGARRRSSRST